MGKVEAASARQTRAGRKSKILQLEPSTRQRFMELLSRGTPQSWACKALGISYCSLLNWRARAERGEQPYLDFVRDFEQAQASFVVRTLLILDADAVGAPLGDRAERCDGKTLTWMLERLFPKDFARQHRHEHTGHVAVAVGWVASGGEPHV